MENDPGIFARIGTFFYLVGAGLIMLFMASDFSENPDFNYFFLGVFAFAIGFYFHRRAAPQTPSNRFRGIRGLLERRKKKKEKGDKK